MVFSLKKTIPVIACITLISLANPSIAQNATDPTDIIIKEIKVLKQRVEQLEAENAQLSQSLDAPYISDSEPEISARLKAVESLANSHRSAASTIENLQGIETTAGLTIVAQNLSGEPEDAGHQAELNYRGDVSVSLPAGSIGASEGFMFAHFRMGQGLGLENPGDAFSSFNSTSFQRPGSLTADSTVLLAQAWYQLNIPLPLGGNPALSKQHLEVNFGKIDPFMFFDQNAIADDETRGFMNQAFVHNALLDVGGDIGVDDFGFTPGFRMAWINETQSPLSYGLSLGIFSSAEGASFNDSLSDPFIIIQAETQQHFFVGLEGNYRVYYWQNGRAKNLNDIEEKHAGFGLSIDQKVDDYTTLFARYGSQTTGEVRFDQSLTLGVDFGGSYWHRGADALGISLGWLSLSDEYQQASNTLLGFNASGQEQIAEIFYRYRLNSQIEISPNIQYIRQPGGNQQAESMTAFGIRAQLNY